jgi:hypothetical protein
MSSEASAASQPSGVAISMKIEDGKMSGKTLFDPVRGIIMGSTMKTTANMQISMGGFQGSEPRVMHQKLNQTDVMTLAAVEDI